MQRLITASYIVQNKHINEQAVKCELAVRCLKYLCLLSLSNGYDDHERLEKTKRGWFSFQDYACSQWHSHVATVITTCSDLFFDTHRGQEYGEMFGSALHDFIETHIGELTTEPHQEFQISSKLAKFSGLSFYQNLLLVWNHIYTHQKGAFDARNIVGIAQLDKALQENRSTLEQHFRPISEACLGDTIEDYYGPNLFKCKRVLCKFFYHGYDRKKDRDTHDIRHARPFLCPVNCSLAPIGFASNKDRERHVRTYHPDQSEGPSVFEALRPKAGSSRFRCNLCGATFTRKITLKGHERSHFGERPYTCSICDKAFARLNDCRRHEKIHARKRA